MESRAKFLGHPIHQMLIVFPLGLLVTAVIFDILYLITDNEFFATAAFYNMTAGIIGGALAAIFGFIDFSKIPNETRAKRVGMLHGYGNLVVLTLFSFSWVFRSSTPGYTPTVLALGFSFLAFSIAAVTAWLGGELVNRLGVGVDEGANLNAPSSLSREEAYPPARVDTVPVTGAERVLDDTPPVTTPDQQTLREEMPIPSKGRAKDDPEEGD